MEIRRAVLDDIDGYLECQSLAMEAAYRHFMPPAFFDQRRAETTDRATELRDAITAHQLAVEAGVEPEIVNWVAVDDATVVGLACAARHPAEWEATLGVPTPPLQRNLAKLYALPDWHGTGIGQQLLDAALPDRQGAYLWVMQNNPRAERFYLRNGFVPDGVAVPAGESWFHKPMQRMWRAEAGSRVG